jgi:sugar lactone lactonase YvrE
MKVMVGLGLWAVWLGACGGSPASSPGKMQPPDETEDAGGGGQGPAPKLDAAVVRDSASSSAPDLESPAAEVSPLAPDQGTTVEPDAAAPDTAPPLGEFPAEAVKAAKFSQYARVNTHLEGPSLRDGNLFFASDGNGFLRADAAGKVYKYHPRLAPVGSYWLSVDNSLLVCDKSYTVVQIFADGSVAGLLSDADRGRINFCNDVAVDARGNIYFTQARAGDIWRLTPEGVLDKVTGGHNYPNGVEIDRESKYLYFSTNGIQRLTIPESGTGFGAPQSVGGPDNVDGMAFDAWGNLWISVYAGGLRIWDVNKKAAVATFGGVANNTNLTIANDMVYVTVANSGLAKASIPGMRPFLHPGAPRYAIKKMLDLKPVDDPL